jgi:pimeloyl-ACP methyl ester carboxylesterase
VSPEQEGRAFEVRRDGLGLAGEEAGEGPPIVLLHGLTATRRYVVMGSRLLERRGYRLISYDARGHGESGAPQDPSAYEYRDLAEDLRAVLDHLGVERAVLAGSSMGAATAVSFALDSPERVGALVQSTPAYAGPPNAEAGADWERLADAVDRDGIDGFMEVFQPSVDDRWQDSVRRLTRQRLERHSDLGALARALRVVTRSTPFEGLTDLERIQAPTLVVGSRDEADPEHPLAVAEAYVERLPNAELAIEAPGKPPLAWRGAQLSRTIAEFLGRRAPEMAAHS